MSPSPTPLVIVKVRATAWPTVIDGAAKAALMAGGAGMTQVWKVQSAFTSLPLM
jgi:hypothetical protein